MILALAFSLTSLSAQDTHRYQARHDHLRKACSGELEFTASGVSFREVSKKKKKAPHQWTWAWQDIQQFLVEPSRVKLLTYEDVRWKFGSDREHRFDIPAGSNLSPIAEMLKQRLDQRFVSAIAAAPATSLWSVPVKQTRGIKGSQGVLHVGQEMIVFETRDPHYSRTWRYADIDNVSTSGPFELTLTTYERARGHYGNRKDFRFQLKQPLPQSRIDELWMRLHDHQDLSILRQYRKDKTR